MRKNQNARTSWDCGFPHHAWASFVCVLLVSRRRAGTGFLEHWFRQVHGPKCGIPFFDKECLEDLSFARRRSCWSVHLYNVVGDLALVLSEFAIEATQSDHIDTPGHKTKTTQNHENKTTHGAIKQSGHPLKDQTFSPGYCSRGIAFSWLQQACPPHEPWLLLLLRRISKI